MTTRDSILLSRHSAATSIVSISGSPGRDSRQELVAALAVAGERGNIVVDLSGADAVDPALVNAVQRTAEWLIGTSARLALVIPARAHGLRSLFETVGATHVATLHATRAGALAALARPRPESPGSRRRAA